MSTVTLPPIGAKVRATRTLDGTTVTVEGVITSAYGRGYSNADRPPTIVLAGNEHVKLAEWAVSEGIWTAAVEVLELPPPPEPADESRLLGADGATYERHDNWRAAKGEARWFNTNSGGPDRWELVWRQAAPTVLLVPNPAAAAPSLPWRVDAVDGVSVLADRHGVDDPWARNGDAYIQLQSPGHSLISRAFTPAESRALAAVLLAAADDQEAGQQ